MGYRRRGNPLRRLGPGRRGALAGGDDLEAAGAQAVTELDETEQVLESVQSLQRATRLATGRDVTSTNLLEDFGFTGQKLVTRISELSGGERRRLQFLRLLLSEPNVLLLDEPTNDLDIDTLTVIEDYLDTWPGTLIVVSHDRYFLERTCDVQYALLGDGSCVLLPGGVEEYLRLQRRFAHLFGDPPRTDVIERLQAIADRNIRRFGLLEEVPVA